MTNYIELLAHKTDATVKTESFRDNVRLIVPADKSFACLKVMKEEGFDMLCDIAGVDYLNYPEAADRFGVVYALTNTKTGERIFVKTYVNDPDPELKSVYDLWTGADWLEREVYDMFGIRFPGHPDLRRILLPDEFTSHPLRKDYPLRGAGERHNFPALIRSEG